MAPRNRRKSSGAAENDVKRLKTEAPSDLFEFCLWAIASLNEIEVDNYKIVSDFLVLPSKKLFPDYYVEISSPISIHEIKAKVKAKKYGSLVEFVKDFELMNDNAIRFNGKDSDIALSSKKILDTIREKVEQYNTNTQASVAPPLPKLKLKLNKATKKETSTSKPADNKPISKAELKPKLLAIIEYLINFQDNNVAIADPFLDEVSKKDYPDYYKVIKHVMALNTVKKNINNNKYPTIDSFKEHVDLVWSNAQLYNHPDSLIYQDSKTLENASNSKINELKESLGIKVAGKTISPVDSTTVDLDTTNIDHSTPAETSQVQEYSEDEGQDVEETSQNEVHDDEEQEEDEDEDDQEDEEDEEEDEESEEKDEGEENDDDNNASGIDDTTSEKVDTETSPLFSVETDPSTYLKIIKQNTYVNPQTQVKPKKALIQEIDISSSRSIYRQTARAAVTASSDAHLPVFQNWFEYRFESTETFNKNKPKSFTIVLPYQPSGSVLSLTASLNDSLLKKKHNSILTVNGERVNPQPSIHYADTGRQLTSRYELKLPHGLNKIKFDISLITSTEGQYGLIDRKYNAEEQESMIFWVQVS